MTSKLSAPCTAYNTLAILYSENQQGQKGQEKHFYQNLLLGEIPNPYMGYSMLKEMQQRLPLS